jgi:hypothetical protein
MSTDTYDDTRGSAATGWIMFAAAVMFTIGAIDIIQGIVALTKSTTYVIPGGENALLVTTNFDTWGWALIIWGIVLMLAAGSLFAGRSWARWFGIFAILINGIGQIAWFPAYPLWSLLAIGLEIAVLWALTAGWKGAQAELRGDY